jgi:hypothetical protein
MRMGWRRAHDRSCSSTTTAEEITMNTNTTGGAIKGALR